MLNKTRRSWVFLFSSTISVFLIISVVGVSCSQITPASKDRRPALGVDRNKDANSNSKLYGEPFLRKIQDIKRIYESGKRSLALKRLNAIKDSGLNNSEQAFKYNLKGVIFFSEGKYENATAVFNKALETVGEKEIDEVLLGQIYINLASCYYKNTGLKDHLNQAQDSLRKVKVEMLKDAEIFKYHRLRFLLSDAVGDGNTKEQADILIDYFSGYKDVSAYSADPLYPALLERFNKLGRQQQSDLLLEKTEHRYCLVVAQLGVILAEKIFSTGDKDAARSLLSRLLSQLRRSENTAPAATAATAAAIKMLTETEYRLENFYKINALQVGVVLPLSGEKNRFSQQALAGIDCAFRQLIASKAPGSRPVPGFNTYSDALTGLVFNVRDSMGSGVVGAEMVEELAKKYSVSAVIGGLFPEEAEKEYLAAKKQGVFFISLSPVYLPKSQKDFLLLEIPGSVESQIETLMNSDFLHKFGKRVALFYPNDSRGHAYTSEFWDMVRNNNNNNNASDPSVPSIVAAQSYDKDLNDFRGPVKGILGLKFERERQEELDLYSSIVALSAKPGQRQVQNLPPIVDFDWVFTPAYPDEAQKFVPIFKYYDAYKIRFVGGPSWRNQALAKFSERQPLFFVGEVFDKGKGEDLFKQFFSSQYGRSPKLIETLSYNAARVLFKLLGLGAVSHRGEFIANLLAAPKIEGIGGDWRLKGNLWFKEMGILKLSKGKIEQFDFAAASTSASARDSSGRDSTEEDFGSSLDYGLNISVSE
ncbi:MAG: hypothetical protein HQK53_00060 [Oligoflexia bacterium]|nr:hypothetical protein [Oligoflexia bacterium]